MGRLLTLLRRVFASRLEATDWYSLHQISHCSWDILSLLSGHVYLAVGRQSESVSLRLQRGLAVTADKAGEVAAEGGAAGGVATGVDAFRGLRRELEGGMEGSCELGFCQLLIQ